MRYKWRNRKRWGDGELRDKGMDRGTDKEEEKEIDGE